MSGNVFCRSGGNWENRRKKVYGNSDAAEKILRAEWSALLLLGGILQKY